jgi:hypothetical protein
MSAFQVKSGTRANPQTARRRLDRERTIHFETGRVICCTEHRLGLKRYVIMTVTWTIMIAWLAIQVPLGVLIGKTIKLGTIGHAKKSAPSGVVWC